MHRGSRARPPVVIGRQAKSMRSGVDRGLLVDLSANPGGTLPPRRGYPDRTRAGRHTTAGAPCRLRPHGTARLGPLSPVDRGPLRHQPRRGRRRRPLHHSVRRRGRPRPPRSRLGAAARGGEVRLRRRWRRIPVGGGHFGDRAGGVPAFTVPQIDEPGCGPVPADLRQAAPPARPALDPRRGYRRPADRRRDHPSGAARPTAGLCWLLGQGTERSATRCRAVCA